MNNLFNKNYAKETIGSREFEIRYWFLYKTKSILYDIKQQQYYIAEKDIIELKGMTKYAYHINDIDKETYNKIYNITTLLEKKLFYQKFKIEKTC